MNVNWSHIVVAAIVGSLVSYFVTKAMDRALFHKELRAIGH